MYAQNTCHPGLWACSLVEPCSLNSQLVWINTDYALDTLATMVFSVVHRALAGAWAVLQKLPWIVCVYSLLCGSRRRRRPKSPFDETNFPDYKLQTLKPPILPDQPHYSSMALNPRSITVAAANFPGGVRCYTKVPGGEVREASLALSDQALSKALREGNSNVVASTSGWTSATLPFKVHPQSTLCTIAWDDQHQSIFYQDEHEALAEHRLKDGKTWVRGNLKPQKIKTGSNIAAVYCAEERKAVIFYQNKHNKIAYQTGRYDQWDAPASIPGTETHPCTGIGAAAWDDLGHIRVYYQNKDKHIREICRDPQGHWTPTEKSVVEAKYPIGDITAIGWGTSRDPKIRLYIQDKDSNIVEYMNTTVPFAKGDFKQPSMPNSDIIGFVRNVNAEPGFCINIMWVNEKQILKQRIFDGHKWLAPADLVYLGFPGNCPGNWEDAEKFSDEELATTVKGDAERKSIAEVRLRVRRGIKAISVLYTDGDATPVHGEEHGDRKTFKLEPGEDITTVWYRTDRDGLTGLQFGTSKNRTSQWYGGDDGEFGSWSGDDHALIGFFGAVQAKEGVTGLMPIWSQVQIPAVPEKYQAKFNAIKDDLPRITAEHAKIEAQAAALQARWAATDAQKRAAVDALAELTESVEILHGFEHAKTHARVRATERRNRFVAEQLQVCNADADAVKLRLHELADVVSALPAEASKLRAEIDALQKVAQQAGLEAEIQKEIALVNGRKEGISASLESRKKDVADAQAAADRSAARYKEESAKSAPKQNGVAHEGPQNPFGSPSAQDDEDDEDETLRDARTQQRKDANELAYHVAHRDFLAHAIARMERETTELTHVTALLRDALQAPEIKKALADVAAVEAQVVARAQEIDEIVALTAALRPLADQLAGKPDARAFAAALVPIVKKVEAHAGLTGLSKVTADILLAAAKHIAA